MDSIQAEKLKDIIRDIEVITKSDLVIKSLIDRGNYVEVDLVFKIPK